MDVNAVFEEQPTIYAGSAQYKRSELNLFELPPTDVSTLFSTEYTQCFPVVSIKENNNPLEFQTVSDQTGYLDIANSYVALTTRIVQQDGKKCDATDVVAPSNLFFQTMWSNLEVYINGQLIIDTSNYYGYIAYIQRLLSTSEIEKNNQLLDEYWYPNVKPDTYTEATDAGFKTRFTATKQSQQFFMLGKLVGNVFNQQRYFPAGTEFRVVLKRASPAICLDCANDTKEGFNGIPYMYVIDEAVMYIPKVIVSKEIINEHREKLALNQTCLYPTNEVELKTFTIAKGLTSITSDSLILGKMPKILVVGFVDSDAFSGKLSKSPFNFKHMNLSEIVFTWNGITVEHRVISYSFKTANGTGTDNFLIPLRTLRKTSGTELLGNGINRNK